MTESTGLLEDRVFIDGQVRRNLWEFYKDSAGEYRWRVFAGENMEAIGASSEGYRDRRNCWSNARRLGYSGPFPWGRP